MMAAGGAVDSGTTSGSINWKTPVGWAETKGSGMRLATFAVNSGGDAATCTIVLLGGNAGGLEANILRWIGQAGLKPLSEDEMKSFVSKQQTIKSDGGLDVFIADLTTLSDKNAKSTMIASIVTVGESTGFVKLSGPAEVLTAQKENFIQLCKSLTK
jgi:hypothetical protein